MISSDQTHVFPRSLDRSYPIVDRGEGVWLTTIDGRRILDACSGGAMTASLGHGLPEIAAAAAEQASQLAYYYNHHFTSEPQERLAERLTTEVAPGMARVRFVSGGSEANETALQLARLYHVENGDEQRWRVVSAGPAYHGSSMGTLALSGRAEIRSPHEPYLTEHLHIPWAAWRMDPSGQAALDALDGALEEAGGSVAAFLCEAIGGASLPAYSPGPRFWEGLEERREHHGFLIWFDEVVTGMGRVGTWLASDQLPLQPDIVTIGKGLGAGYAPLGAVMCRSDVYDAIDRGSREFDLGHTWDGAPLPAAVGLAVLDVLQERELVDRVAQRGPSLLTELRAALEDCPIVGEVRGRGFLLGVELVDPSDGRSALPHERDVASLVEDAALRGGLLIMAARPDREAPDQVLMAPAFTSTDAELADVVEGVTATLAGISDRIGG